MGSFFCDGDMENVNIRNVRIDGDVIVFTQSFVEEDDGLGLYRKGYRWCYLLPVGM